MPNRLKTSTLLLFLLVLVCLNAFGRDPAGRDCGTDEYKASIERYTKAIKFSKYDYLAYVGRGRAYLGLGDHNAAYKDLNRAIEIQPKGDAAYYERGRLFRERSNIQKAVSDFTRAIELNPFNSDAFYYRARSMWDGEKDPVISDLSHAIELSPSDYYLYEARGVALLIMSLKQQAMVDLNKAIEMLTKEIDQGEKSPCYGQFHLDRGYIVGSLQRYSEAMSDLNRALKIDPSDFQAYQYRAHFLAVRRKYGEALADLNKAIELHPSHAYVYEDRAKVYDKLNQKEKAAADRQKSLALSSSLPSNL
jgi:tetratricopeptide (TPR) repeat protein